MDDFSAQIEKNAGKIYQRLNAEDLKQASAQELKDQTDLTDHELFLSIGWLAKENKINKSKNNGLYYLGESSIAADINKHAERVRHTLQNKSKKNVASIARSAELRPMEVYIALGWLAREDKIMFFRDRTLQHKYSLKD